MVNKENRGVGDIVLKYKYNGCNKKAKTTMGGVCSESERSNKSSGGGSKSVTKMTAGKVQKKMRRFNKKKKGREITTVARI